MALVEFTDRQQLAYAIQAVRQADQDALSDPVSLARYLDPAFVVRGHTKAIGDALAAVADGDTKRLLITLPPQVGKSQLAAMWAPFWWLCRHPTARVIVACYGQSLAVTRGRAIRRMVQEHGRRWGLHLERGSTAVHEWRLTTGGGVKAVGALSAVTGSPGDCIFVDDVVKGRAEAESLLQRDKTSDWWSADLLSRLAPSAPVVMLGTLWHWDDQYARVIEQDGRIERGGLWRVLRMPAFADATDDPLERRIGDPLPHPKIANDDVDGLNAHWAQRKQQTQVRDWNALYQCDPQPTEGALVSAALLRAQRYIPAPVGAVKNVVAVDPSGGGRDTAGIVGGFLGTDGRVYLSHDVSMVGSSHEWGRAAAQLAADIDADYVIYEKNYGGDTIKTVIRSAWDALAREAQAREHSAGEPDEEAAKFRRIPPNVRDVTAKKNKLLRAEPIAQQFHDDRLRLASYLAQLESEWCTWQSTDPNSPGRIDASVYIVYDLLTVPGEETRVTNSAGTTQQDIEQRLARKGRRRRITD